MCCTSEPYGRYSLGIKVREATSTVHVHLSDRRKHQSSFVGFDQPPAPIPISPLTASAPRKALRMFLHYTQCGKTDAPLQDDPIGLWLTVERHGKERNEIAPAFIGTALLCRAPIVTSFPRRNQLRTTVTCSNSATRSSLDLDLPRS